MILVGLLVQYIDLALKLSGFALTVGVVEEEQKTLLVAASPEPACKMDSTQELARKMATSPQPARKMVGS